MAKQLDAPYLPGKRKGLAKVKRERTIDCVVMGWRPGKEEGTVGSLILGLYDGDELRSVGHISGFSAAAKRSMRAMLAPLETGESGSAEPSRWTGGRDLEWVALRPELVIEVGYDHAAAGRIRHGARFHRFRDDKEPQECLFEQLDEGARQSGGGRPPPRAVGQPPVRQRARTSDPSHRTARVAVVAVPRGACRRGRVEWLVAGRRSGRLASSQAKKTSLTSSRRWRATPPRKVAPASRARSTIGRPARGCR